MDQHYPQRRLAAHPHNRLSKSRNCAVVVRPVGDKGQADVPHLLQQFEQLPGLIEVAWKAAGPAKG
jgi:hypothetical protein